MPGDGHPGLSFDEYRAQMLPFSPGAHTLLRAKRNEAHTVLRVCHSSEGSHGSGEGQATYTQDMLLLMLLLADGRWTQCVCASMYGPFRPEYGSTWLWRMCCSSTTTHRHTHTRTGPNCRRIFCLTQPAARCDFHDELGKAMQKKRTGKSSE